MPKRLRLAHYRGYRMPAGAVNCSRRTRWGNPWIVQSGSGFFSVAKGLAVAGDFSTESAAHEAAAGLYRAHAESTPQLLVDIQAKLAGRDLACWCPPDLACHVDVLLELANPPEPSHG